jgi:hypothetical protein
VKGDRHAAGIQWRRNRDEMKRFAWQLSQIKVSRKTHIWISKRNERKPSMINPKRFCYILSGDVKSGVQNAVKCIKELNIYTTVTWLRKRAVIPLPCGADTVLTKKSRVCSRTAGTVFLMSEVKLPARKLQLLTWLVVFPSPYRTILRL